jgi:hypothetical protein
MGLLIVNNMIAQIYNCLLQWNVNHRYYTMKSICRFHAICMLLCHFMHTYLNIINGVTE